MSVNEFQLDFHSLEKGQFFSNERLEDIVGISKASDETGFRYAVLEFQQSIHNFLGFTAKIENYGLKILTDSEAIFHNRKISDSGVRSIHKRNYLMQNVDPSNLSSEQRDALNKHLLIVGSRSQALKNSKRKIVFCKPTVLA